MKKGYLIPVLLVAYSVLAGCTQADIPEEISVEVRPGVYLGNELTDFPFPTSGYDVYLVGETHGNRETKTVFYTFLNRLYQEAGLRDVILEEDQAYETDANAYVRGLTDELVEGLCLRTDILGQIREFNTNLPEDQKVNLHLVDVDSPMPTIYKHIAALNQELGAAGNDVALPEFLEFNTWVPQQRSELVDELKQSATGHQDILQELESISLSLQWYNLGNRMDTGWPSGFRRNFAPVREDVITRNIQNVLSQANGKPILAFFGSGHGMKLEASLNPPTKGFKAWAQRIAEEGASVYSVSIDGTSGEGYWRGEAFEYEVEGNQQYTGVEGFQFDDGTPLLSYFESHPGYGILYADLRTEENRNVQLPPGLFRDIPAGQVYDGIIIYKEFTPMENACPKE